MQLTHGLRRSRSLNGSRLATICGERRTDWATLENRVSRLAHGLREQGATPGSRIAILAGNSDHYVEAYYAIAWAGCIAVPFNTRWAPAEIRHAVEDSRPLIMILDAAFSNEAAAFAQHGIAVVQMDAAGANGSENLLSFGALIEASAPMSDLCGTGDELAAIFYTGGTTGRAKGVMLSHTNLIVNFLALQGVAPYDPDTVFLHTPPMFHLADAGCLFGLTTLGATHVILPGFEPKSTIAAIEDHGVTALVLVPTMIGMLCEEMRERPADLSGVRRLTYGASSISAALLQRAMQILPNASFCQGYGQTELSPVATILVHADHLEGRLTSAGRPLPQAEIRIVDPDMRELAPGEVGEVAVRGPGVMLGYWEQPEMTAQTIVDGWLRTGDAGRVDNEGYLYLVDRVKDMIVSGGENVYSAEVENALQQHPDVVQCAVIGIPNSRWGEAVHAIVYLRPGSTATIDGLIAHCRPLIANYKLPKSIEFRSTPLPLSGVGKIMKSELREPYWSDAERRIG